MMTLQEMEKAFDCWTGRDSCDCVTQCKAKGCPFAEDNADCSAVILQTIDELYRKGLIADVGKDTHEGKYAAHARICEELTDMYARKNADYGDSFGKGYQEYGLTMPLIRLQDKLNRVKQLAKHTAKVDDERIEDTLRDLANYAIMTLIELESEDRDDG